MTDCTWKRSRCRSASNLRSYWWPAGATQGRFVFLLPWFITVNSFLMISWPLALVSTFHVYILMFTLYILAPFQVKYTINLQGVATLWCVSDLRSSTAPPPHPNMVTSGSKSQDGDSLSQTPSEWVRIRLSRLLLSTKVEEVFVLS